jgi:hypothetical protein
MNKFKVHKQDVAEIEIARAFDRPMTCMLSRYVFFLAPSVAVVELLTFIIRALIMILEDRGQMCHRLNALFAHMLISSRRSSGCVHATAE